MSDLVLASASPRRAELLRSAGLEFEVRPVDCDESWRAGEAPLAYVERVARAKAEAALAQAWAAPTTTAATPAPWILTADTTVWLDADTEPLAKPQDAEHAAAMLRALTRGRPHRVSTACAFARFGRELHAFTETTEVHMRGFSDPQFEAFIGPYLEAAAWADKAGGYAIQGRAAALVERIVGSYTAVVGLPLAQVVATLEELRAHG